jgi:hypothetical protein
MVGLDASATRPFVGSSLDGGPYSTEPLPLEISA